VWRVVAGEIAGGPRPRIGSQVGAVDFDPRTRRGEDRAPNWAALTTPPLLTAGRLAAFETVSSRTMSFCESAMYTLPEEGSSPTPSAEVQFSAGGGHVVAGVAGDPLPAMVTTLPLGRSLRILKLALSAM